MHTFDLRQTLPEYLITILNEIESLTNLANGPIIFTYYAEKELSISTIQYALILWYVSKTSYLS